MIALILAAQVATAPNLCGPAPNVIASLATKYGEAIKWTGRARNGAVALMASRKGTWTIIIMPSPEIACIVGSGNASREIFGDPV